MPPKKTDNAETIGKKLQPIYDALDTNNNKQAIKLIGPAITKYGRRPILLTLWAIALVRLDQRDEATALANEVIETKPTDIHLISTLMIVLRALGIQSRSTEIWQNAAALNPGDEQTQFQLFCALTRDHSYQSAQPTAMKLYTGFKREKYLFYNAVNQLLIHQNEGPNRMLQLADMMIKRAVAPHTASGEGLPAEHVRLLVSLSVRQGDYTACESLLSSPLASLYSMQQRREYCEDLSTAYSKLGWHDKRLHLLRNMLLDFEADWVYFQQWLDEEFALWRVNHPSESMTQAHVTALHDFINALEQRVTDDQKRASTRNPFLGRVELAFRLATQQDHSEPLQNERAHQNIPLTAASSVIDHLMVYFELYGNKTCFFPDVQHYIDSFSQSARSALFSAMLTHVGALPAANEWPANDPASCKRWSRNLSMQISYHQCRAFTGEFSSMNVDQLKEQAHLMYRSYLFSLLVTQDTPVSSERGLGDPFLVLFQSVTRLLHKLTNDTQFDFCSLLVVEHALKHFTQHNYDLQLATMRLYCQAYFAGPRIAVEKFKALDIKQIQHESLCHLIIHDCLRYHDISDCQWSIDRLLTMHSMYHQNEGQSIDRAYERQNWSKVFEISEMYQRMKNSGVKRLAVEMNRTLALLRTSSFEISAIQSITASALPISDISAEELVMNSDYDIVACYDPPESDSHTMLHRPSASHLPADRLIKSPTRRLSDNSFPVDQQYADSIQLHSCLSTMINHLITSESQPLRIQLGILRSIIEADELFDFAVAAPGAANLPLDANVWWLTFMSAETGACCIETSSMSQPALLTAACNDEAVMQDHILRWGSVQRQINVLAELVVTTERALSQTARFEAGISVEAMVVNGVKNNAKATDIKLLRPSTLFLTYACSVLSVVIQCCIRDWPSRKQVKKKVKDAETDQKTNLLKVWSCINEAQDALAQLMAVYKHSLQSLEQTVMSIAAAPFPYSSGFLLTAECASMLEDASAHWTTTAGSSPTAKSPFGSLLATYHSVSEALTQNYQSTAADVRSSIAAHLNTLGRGPKA